MFTSIYFFFFFNDTATTEIYTLSLHDALPILDGIDVIIGRRNGVDFHEASGNDLVQQKIKLLRITRAHQNALAIIENFGLQDRKSTRLNSSHGYISYAVFCFKKKRTQRA